MVRDFEAVNRKEVLLGPGGRMPVVNHVMLHVMPDWSTPEANDVLISTSVNFLAVVEDGPRIIGYKHGTFGTPPEQLERWVWRAPADDPAPPGDEGGEG